MKSLLSLFLIMSIFTCQRPSADGNTEEETATAILHKASSQEITEKAIEVNKAKAIEMQASQQKLDAPLPLPSKWNLPKSGKLCQNKYACHQEVIYPIGWSKDGKFAYCVEYPMEAADMYRMDFFIQDLATGEMVDQASFKGESTLNLQEIWNNKNLDFSEALTKYKIHTTVSFGILPFPLNWQGTSISSSVEKQMKMNDYAGVEIVSESQLIIKGKGLQDRQIAKQTYGKYDLVLDTEVLGYLKSPFEERILVIYAKEKRGFEGPPNVLSLSLIGCDLKALNKQ